MNTDRKFWIPKTSILDYAGDRSVAHGAVSADVLGKLTLSVLVEALVGFDIVEGLIAGVEIMWRQNNTGHDAVLTLASGEKLRVEIKWSSIQLQTNKNNNSKQRSNYFRWEFGNIDPTKFDIAILFGQCAAQVGATRAEVLELKKEVNKQQQHVEWEPKFADGAMKWLQSLRVWVFTSAECKQMGKGLHSNVFYSRGGAYQGNMMAKSSNSGWGVKPKTVAKVLITKIKAVTAVQNDVDVDNDE